MPDLQYYHNLGERDYAEHKGYGYSKPHRDLIDIPTAPSEEVGDRWRAENDAYDQGYANARDQDD